MSKEMVRDGYTIFDASKGELPEKLQTCITDGSHSEGIFTSSQDVIFCPNHPDDHVFTDFLPLKPLEGSKKNYLKISMLLSEPAREQNFLRFVLQDRKYNNLCKPFAPVSPDTKAKMKKIGGALHWEQTVEIKDPSLKEIRLNMRSVKNHPTYMPLQLRIEQITDDGLRAPKQEVTIEHDEDDFTDEIEAQTPEQEALRAKLAARIARDLPIVASENLSDLRLTSLLRSWVASKVRIAARAYYVDFREWRSLSIFEIIDRLEADSCGIQDAGVAYFLQRVYETFGFEAASCQFRTEMTPHVLSRTVTLVRISDDQTTSVIMQDAYTNSRLAFAGGGVVDLAKALEFINSSRSDSLMFDGERTDCYALWSEEEGRSLLGDGAEQALFKKFEDGRRVFKLGLAVGEFYRHFMETPAGQAFQQAARNHALRPDAMSLFCFPESVEGSRYFRNYLENLQRMAARN